MKSTAPDEIIAQFWHERARRGGQNAARFHSSHTQYDCGFLEHFCYAGSRVLDLGCGTLTLGNWLVAERGARVHGVDGQQDFLDHAIRHPDLTTECADLRTYRPNSMFDVVLMFGVIHYIICIKERSVLYENLRNYIVENGYLIIKSQFGILEAVEVNKYLDEISGQYYSLYPYLNQEVDLLSKLYDVSVHDLYPSDMSPHENTRFFHLVCRAKR